MSPHYSPWLDAGRPVNIFGIPALVYLVFLLWFFWPCVPMLVFCLVLLGAYKLLAMWGYTMTVMLQRILHLLRGTHVSGRPWWYRKFFEES